MTMTGKVRGYSDATRHAFSHGRQLPSALPKSTTEKASEESDENEIWTDWPDSLLDNKKQSHKVTNLHG
jgi:hypothetical protein